MKILIGGVVGGLVMFIWGAVAHMALHVGEDAFTPMPREDTTMAALDGLFPESGLYYFPTYDMSGDMTDEQQKAWEDKYRKGPIGLVLIDKTGREPMSPKLFIVEFVSNTIAALAAAFLASLMVGSYGKRLLALTLLGFIGWASLSVSSWNWYGYPSAMMIGEAIEQILGWFSVALVVARIVPPAKTTA